jgi:hypothetical protein
MNIDNSILHNVCPLAFPFANSEKIAVVDSKEGRDFFEF